MLMFCNKKEQEGVLSEFCRGLGAGRGSAGLKLRSQPSQELEKANIQASLPLL